MTEISIIIPVYMVEPYIHQCLDSVLNQTFTDFELILVDDGSPDKCGAICDEYAEKDRRVRVIHQENRGQGRARNVGMDLAQGKYIIFLDSDDYWLPSTLETLYTEAEKNQTQLLAFSGVPFWDGIEQSGTISNYCHTVQNGIVKSGVESLNFALDAHEYNVSPCLRFYRTDYLQKINVRFVEGIIHEDEVFSFLSYLYADRVECIGDRLYQRRYRPGSTMTGKSPQASAHGYIVTINRLLDVLRFQPCSEQEKGLLDRYISRTIYIVMILYRKTLRCQKDIAAAIRKDARKTLKRARQLSTLTKEARVSTYSLFLSYLGWWVPRVLKRITCLVRDTFFIAIK